MDAFLPGLSNGVICVGYCAPVIVPYLVGQQAGVPANIGIVARFLGGRLAGCLIFSVAPWTLKAGLTRQSSRVMGIEKTYKIDKGFAVRIALRKKPSEGL